MKGVLLVVTGTQGRDWHSQLETELLADNEASRILRGLKGWGNRKLQHYMRGVLLVVAKILLPEWVRKPVFGKSNVRVGSYSILLLRCSCR